MYKLVHVTVNTDFAKASKVLPIAVLFLLDCILNYALAVIGYSALFWCLQVLNSLTSHNYVIVEGINTVSAICQDWLFFSYIQLKYVEALNTFTKTVIYCILTLWLYKQLLKFITSVK